MKYTIEQEILSVAKEARTKETFVQATMQAIQQHATQEALRRALAADTTSKRSGLLQHIRRMPAAAAVTLAIALTAGVGGIAYAAVRYLPSLIHITSSSMSTRGTKQYWSPAFAQCSSQGTERFERNKDAAQLSDNDVQRLIQARCELDTIDQFVSHIWPTYGTHKTWQKGDPIYYGQAGDIGNLESISSTSITVNDSASGASLRTFQTVPGTPVTAYENGAKIPLNDVHKNDTVFVIMRVSEIYNPPGKGQKLIAVSSPKQIGIIGLVKLSQPLQYYGSMQNDLTELPPCEGNAGEYCPSTAQIDVFPAGSEGAQNPELNQPSSSILRVISGQVTKLGADTLVLKSSSGKLYTVTAPTNAFATYNTAYAPQYGDVGILRVGTSVQVTYMQPPHSNQQVITPDQIQVVALMLDGNVKSGKDTQY